MIFFSDLIEERKKLSLDEFVSKLPVPVLLHKPVDHNYEERSFKTGRTNAQAHCLELSAVLTDDPGIVVIRVEKRLGSPYRDRISIGRSRNNDIQIDYPKISKYHAFFKWNEKSRSLSLTDAASTNGTFVNSHRIKPGLPVNIPDSTLISIARYHFRYHLPEKLYDTLSEMT